LDIFEKLKASKPILVGVLNCTPDSFSDGGKYVKAKNAISHGLHLIEDGAHIIDIGGESTGPSANPVDVEEELQRISEPVNVLSKKIFVSVDTFKAATASKVLELGASMINDVSGLRADRDMGHVVRDYNAYLVIMYSKEDGKAPHVSNNDKVYKNIVEEISDFLKKQVDFALSQGISEDKIIVDPGMGAFISLKHELSWLLLERLHEFPSYGITLPMMIGVSRKGFLGGEVEQREIASQLVSLLAYNNGASLIRIHNVRMAKAFLNAYKEVAPVNS